MFYSKKHHHIKGQNTASFWIVFVVLCFGGWLKANLVDSPAYRQGSVLFEQQKYLAAAEKYLVAWAELNQLSGDRVEFERSVLAERVLESWYRGGNTRSAIVWIQQAGVPVTVEVGKWAALLLLEAERYPEAAARFDRLKQSDISGEFRRELSIYQAHAHLRSGMAELALKDVVGYIESPRDVSEAYLFAGVSFLAGDSELGIRLCDHILREIQLFGVSQSSVGFSHRGSGDLDEFLADVVFMKARCLRGLQKNQQACQTVLEHIDQTTNILVVYRGLDILQSIATEKQRQLINEWLSHWQKDVVFPNRQLAARYHSIRWNHGGDVTVLVDRLEHFIDQNRGHSVSRQVVEYLSTLNPQFAAKYHQDPYFATSDKLVKKLGFDLALRQFEQQAFAVAKDTFLEISKDLSGDQRSQARFNSAIAALYAGDESLFDEIEVEIGSPSSIHADLIFLAGLYFASKSNPRAFDLLSRFTQEYPAHTMVQDAQLALAELHLNQVPAHPEAARQIFAKLESELALDQVRGQRLAYAQLWGELLTPGSQLVVEKATAFLVQWPKSRLRAQVSMILGQEFYRREEYAKAQDIFQRIARDFASTGLRELALFLSAKSAAHLDETNAWSGLENWDSVIALDGRLVQEARHSKGMSLLKKDRYEEAIIEFNQILDSDLPISSVIRISAICNKGCCLYQRALALGAEPDVLRAAAEVFAMAASDASSSRSWRYQALVRQGKCLELLNEDDQAFAVYQRLLNDSESDSHPQIGSSPIEENNWLYRAGFAAMDILEKKQAWKASVELAENLAARKGARATEATERAEHLRLRYFIWE